ncbi:MAG TPA: ribosome-associated translation inhibitor RaiA [Tepidisphaeraceae bacterium]|nr:ribosome-associated translation inhibitor RaiA [Tepidisphaeraceae bacterium]
MIVIVSSRHMDVSAPLKQYAEQKADKLTKYYDRIQEVEVVFDAGKDSIRTEMMVHAEHRNMFIAHHDNRDAYACVDGCMDKLERQLTDHKKKFRNRKHPGTDFKRELHSGSPPDVMGEAV